MACGADADRAFMCERVENHCRNDDSWNEKRRNNV